MKSAENINKVLKKPATVFYAMLYKSTKNAIKKSIKTSDSTILGRQMSNGASHSSFKSLYGEKSVKSASESMIFLSMIEMLKNRRRGARMGTMMNGNTAGLDTQNTNRFRATETFMSVLTQDLYDDSEHPIESQFDDKLQQKRKLMSNRLTATVMSETNKHVLSNIIAEKLYE
jgi:hypothetical protein